MAGYNQGGFFCRRYLDGELASKKLKLDEDIGEMNISDLTPCDLSGQTAVVTGASSGIGRAIALALAAAGADVCVHAKTSRQSLETLADEIRQAGRQCKAILCDLAEPANHEALVEQAWAWRAIDAWVNNAGVDVLTGPAAAWSFAEKLQRLWQVDVLASVGLSRAVGQRMQQRGTGVVINMGWDQVATGMEGDSGEMFTTIKGAVTAFSRSLAKSLAPQVRVHCLAPGWIKTAWGDNASEYWQSRACRETLLQRWGTPEDVARVCRFLVSPEAAFMTGQVVCINGGYVASD